jgi:hypothetical protein
MVVQHVDMRADRAVRPATPDDLAEVARLLDATWEGHDFRAPVSARGVAAILRRTPGLTADGLLVLEERGAIVACAAVWDWRRVQRIDIHAIPPHLARDYPTFRPGQPLRQWGLTAVGYRDPEDLAILLRHVNNLALEHGVEQIALVGESDHPSIRVLAGFSTLAVPIGLYVKPLRSQVLVAGRPAFVDMVDI